MVNMKTCKDCVRDQNIYDEWVSTHRFVIGVDGGPPPVVPSSTKRPANYPGPRCATHWRLVKGDRKEAKHAASVKRTYGLKDGDYGKLYEAQGGVCAICKRANGSTRKLSVDHDHDTGEVRGLLCRPCNDMLGHARDDWRMFARATRYLVCPPARGVL